MFRVIPYPIENLGGNNNNHWINIPPSVIAELSESRKRNHTQRAREKINSELSKLDKAKTEADLIKARPIDSQRAYGLPEGLASEDIWKMILDHVHDLDDVIQLRDTCVLFRDLLDRKYTVLRLMQFNEVILKFAHKLGGLNTVLNLRLVCKASAKAVQQYFMKVPTADLKPQLKFCTNPEEMRRHTLSPENIIGRKEFRSGQLIPSFIDDIEFEDPEDRMAFPALRANFQGLVDNAGTHIRKFHFISQEDNLATYNTLRKWVAMMPNLEELGVWLPLEFMEPSDRSELAQLELQPFPTCPKLRKYRNGPLSVLPAILIAQILLANPTILEVVQDLNNIIDDDEWSQRDQNEFRQVLHSLDTLQLERFEMYGWATKPTPLQLIEFRLGWPLKSLTLKVWGGQYGLESRRRGISSRTLFAFINSFQETLEQLEVDWKMHDDGGYLHVTKVRKLKWTFWPDFKLFDFIVALENLQYFDMDLNHCWKIFRSRSIYHPLWFEPEDVARLFPAMKRIRVRMSDMREWEQVWKA